MTVRFVVAGQSRERGSVLLLVLMVCLGLALVIQAMAAVAVCAERALADEISGRTRMSEKDGALAAVRQRMLSGWEVFDWQVVKSGDRPVEGTVGLLETSDWVMQARVRQNPSSSKITVSAWLERGRDGIDLPLAPVVAGSLSAVPGRETPWLWPDCDCSPETGAGSAAAGAPSESAIATAFLRTLPCEPIVADGFSVTQMTAHWRLDPGWGVLARLAESGMPEELQENPAGVRFGPGAIVLAGGRGRWLSLDEELTAADGSRMAGSTIESPLLVLVTGGAGLDARGLGDFFAVVVVDDGSVRLDGTTIHGAVFVTDVLDVGMTGGVRYCRSLLRWAADRSLQRARLVPGTRWEGTE